MSFEITDPHGVLEKLGVDVSELDEATACRNCQGEEKMELSFDVVGGDFVLFCGCGNTHGGYASLKLTLNKWNRNN